MATSFAPWTAVTTRSRRCLRGAQGWCRDTWAPDHPRARLRRSSRRSAARRQRAVHPRRGGPPLGRTETRGQLTEIVDCVAQLGDGDVERAVEIGGSGVLVAAYVVLDPTEEAAAHRAADLSQGQLAFAYDVTTLGFTNVWLAMGSFALACGWVIVSTKALPRWLGWWGVVSGIALGLAQFVWMPRHRLTSRTPFS